MNPLEVKNLKVYFRSSIRLPLNLMEHEHYATIGGGGNRDKVRSLLEAPAERHVYSKQFKKHSSSVGAT